jgi:precorrin-2 dehydrogenase / sirohydrochlorin ferrochelatase
VSGYPLMLVGESIDAVIVGGGPVAERKARSLLAAGARVRVVAPRITEALRALARDAPRLSLVEREYVVDDIADATLVIAATGSRAVNARVAADGRGTHRLVNVVDDPPAGNCVTVATHRAGDLVIGVSAGGVPRAASRIRDALAERFDDRYAHAVRALGSLRERVLSAGDRAEWKQAVDELISETFCERVEGGGFLDEVAAWR